MKFHQKFSPTILETKAPDEFIKIINRIGDDVLSNDVKSKEWDFSEKLVGKVKKEVQIPMTDKDESTYCLDIMKTACLDYLKEMIELNRAYDWMKVSGGLPTPTKDNINIAQSWIVSQYPGEYNPWHKHSGNFSAVIYLKIPKDIEKEYDIETRDHYPSTGFIEFMYGQSEDFRSDTAMFKPEVGKMLVFPSWLKHSVYPFYTDGERRSMSFNAYYGVRA